MKKFLFLAAALIAMGCGMSSCSNEVDVTEKTEQAPKLTKLAFTVAQDAGSRVEWGGANNRTPMFEEGDKVSLFSENNTNTMLTAHVDGEGNVTLEGEGTSGDANLYFVYPYDANAGYYSYDPEMIFGNATSWDISPYNYSLENILNPGIDKYPSNAFSLATSTDGGESAITFQGLTTIIKFIPASDCTGYININAGDDVFPLTGVNIDLNESKITTENMTEDISLPKGNPTYNFEAGKSYYFALPAFTMLSGGYIKFVDDEYEEHTLYTATADKEFVAGKIYNLNYTGESAPQEVSFGKTEWTGQPGTRNSFTLTKEGISIKFSIAPPSPRMPEPQFSVPSRATGSITFQNVQENDKMNISVSGGDIISVKCSATDKTLEGGELHLTYKTSPSAGWYDDNNVMFIGNNISSVTTFIVVYK